MRIVGILAYSKEEITQPLLLSSFHLSGYVVFLGPSLFLINQVKEHLEKACFGEATVLCTGETVITGILPLNNYC